MTPKVGESSSRKRKEKAPFIISHDVNRFYTKIHEEHYYKNLSKKKVIPEVRFDLKPDEEFYTDLWVTDKHIRDAHPELRFGTPWSEKRPYSSDICLPGAHWRKDAMGHPYQLGRHDLKPVARGLLEFIQRSILPASNRIVAKTSTSAGLAFPHLIFRLCEAANVQIDRDILIAVDRPITRRGMEYARELRQAPPQETVPPPQ
ncbi:hypothetical protein AHAS_Ahas07G0169200 [Arachis hypogaea]